MHSGKTKLLVDIGVSCRAAETALQIGVDHEEIGALLVTHEHSDHIRGLPL
ncbi:MAG: MBL fold metallo-hydrolase [Oscillospiraceae bacterium]